MPPPIPDNSNSTHKAIRLARRPAGHGLISMDLIVGRIIEASDHPGARAPSYLLRVDVGTRGVIEAQMEPGGHAKDTLAGTLVVVSLDDEAIVLCARSHDHGPVLVRPEEDVEPGTVVA
jgi:hypothetical protein